MIGGSDDYYYCLITDIDGSMAIQTIQGGSISNKKKELNEAYKADLKKWTAAYKAWAKVAGRKPYPVPKPISPRINKLAQIPIDEDNRPKARERHAKKLDVWNVCIIKAVDGSRAAQVIRRDKMHREKTKLLTEYAEAALEWFQARKDDPEGTKDSKPPGNPSIRIFKAGLRDADAADRLAEKLSAKLNPGEKRDGDDDKGKR